jgi:hypothetical protein
VCVLVFFSPAIPHTHGFWELGFVYLGLRSLLLSTTASFYVLLKLLLVILKATSRQELCFFSCSFSVGSCGYKECKLDLKHACSDTYQVTLGK